jgi:hypothetical protein
MKKLALGLFFLVLLTGCSKENIGANPDSLTLTSRDFSIQCLQGVQYYVRVFGYKGYMAVVIDSETLQPKRCQSL